MNVTEIVNNKLGIPISICKRDKIRSELEGFSLFYDGGSYNRQIYCLYEWYTF